MNWEWYKRLAERIGNIKAISGHWNYNLPGHCPSWVPANSLGMYEVFSVCWVNEWMNEWNKERNKDRQKGRKDLYPQECYHMVKAAISFCIFAINTLARTCEVFPHCYKAYMSLVTHLVLSAFSTKHFMLSEWMKMLRMNFITHSSISKIWQKSLNDNQNGHK